jgi:hypothetical protein
MLLGTGLLAALWLHSAPASEINGKKGGLAAQVIGGKAPDKVTTETCGDYGTTVHFEPTPSAAAKKALKEEKLVFVLHVSGLFENPDFT